MRQYQGIFLLKKRLWALSRATLLALLLFGCQATALPDETPVPRRPGYLRGTLSNGLNYSIRANDKIENRMIMYLALNVGSLQEEEDQRGLAHFLEHMAFNGTEHFPGNTLLDFSRENGMTFGAHLNAGTSFSDTIYNFGLPTDDEALLDKGLLVLYDWLNGLRIDPEEVEKERGVVLNEWRGSLGFSERYRNVLYPLLLEGSRYEQRLPIGLPEVIENAPAQRLRDFYEKWYSTRNAMVVIVGDFDPEAMQQRLEKLFSSIAERGEILSSGLQREWQEVPIRPPASDELNSKADVRAARMQDDEAPGREIGIYIKGPRLPLPTSVGELRQQIVLGLLTLIAGQRFSDMVKNHSDIVGEMEGFSSESVGSANLYNFNVQAQKGYLKEAYEVLLQGIAQFQQHGVLQSELDLALKTLRSGFEVFYNERDKQNNQSLATDEFQQFLGEGYNSDIAWVYENLDGILAPIRLEQLNELIARILEGSDVSILALSKEQNELPGEQELIEGYHSLAQRQVAAPRQQQLPATLLPDKPQAGEIVKEEQLPRTGYLHWTLSNGIEVYFKHTEFEQSQFEYSAQRPGGILSLSEGETAESVRRSLLNSVVGASGFAGLSPEQYERYMSPLKIGSFWDFYFNSVSLFGGGDWSDSEELFQQIYLSFTAPQFSQKLIDQGIKDLHTSYDDMLAAPEQRFARLLREHWYRNDPRVLVPPPEQFSGYSTSALQRDFEELVPSAQGFRFVFVGNIDEEQLKDYVSRYIASLPTEKTFSKETGKLPLYEQGEVLEYPIGPENKATTVLIWDQYIEPPRFPDEQNYRLFLVANWLLNSLLETRVLKVLREELGKTYSPGAEVSFDSAPENRITWVFQYDSAPEDVAELDATVDRLLNEIRGGTIDESEFRESKANTTKTFEDIRQQNPFWNQVLQQVLLWGYSDIDEVLSEDYFNQVVESISEQELTDFVRNYLVPRRKVRYTMLPKP